MKEYLFYGKSVVFTTDMPENYLVRLGANLAEVRFLESIVDRGYIKPNSLWVDAGANIGNHTVALSQVHSQSSCVSVEANPEIFEYLKQNVALNNLNNVDLHCVGLSSMGGKPYVSRLNRNQIGASTISFMEDGSTTTTRTVDDLVCEDMPVSFIKIDCEGHDLEVLKGSLKTVDCHRPVVAIEIWKPHVWNRIGKPSPRGEIFEIFKSYDYTLTYSDELDNHIFEFNSSARSDM